MLQALDWKRNRNLQGSEVRGQRSGVRGHQWSFIHSKVRVVLLTANQTGLLMGWMTGMGRGRGRGKGRGRG